MKLNATTSLNDAIRLLSCGSGNAGSVLALLHRECPQHVMAYMRTLDKRGVYGTRLGNLFWKECGGDLDTFIGELNLQDAEA